MSIEEKFIIEKVKEVSSEFDELSFRIFYSDLESTFYVEIEPKSLIQDSKFIDFESDLLVEFGTNFPEANLVFIPQGEFGNLGVPLYTGSYQRFFGKNYVDIESILLDDMISNIESYHLAFKVGSFNPTNFFGVDVVSSPASYFTMDMNLNLKRFNNHINSSNAVTYSVSENLCDANTKLDPIAA